HRAPILRHRQHSRLVAGTLEGSESLAQWKFACDVLEFLRDKPSFRWAAFFSSRNRWYSRSRGLVANHPAFLECNLPRQTAFRGTLPSESLLLLLSAADRRGKATSRTSGRCICGKGPASPVSTSDAGRAFSQSLH